MILLLILIYCFIIYWIIKRSKDDSLKNLFENIKKSSVLEKVLLSLSLIILTAIGLNEYYEIIQGRGLYILFYILIIFNSIARLNKKTN